MKMTITTPGPMAPVWGALLCAALFAACSTEPGATADPAPQAGGQAQVALTLDKVP